jgi:hypothetical protein
VIGADNKDTEMFQKEKSNQYFWLSIFQNPCIYKDLDPFYFLFFLLLLLLCFVSFFTYILISININALNYKV